MAINTLEYAKIFMASLDKQLIETATSGWMEANAGQVKYSGGNEVKIPKISMNGLGDYDRDTGFVQGSVTYSYETMKMTQDRGRTFQLDAMDVDDTNFVVAAGNVMGEFQRTQVIPEIDAYRYSAIAARAITASKKTEYTAAADTIISTLLNDIAKIMDIAGATTEVIVTMATPVCTLLSQAKEAAKWVDIGNFSQGGLNFKVRSIDGNPIIAVPSARMKTAYTFQDGSTSGQEAGGIVAASSAQDINWIISTRRAPIAVSKTDVTRIFDPMTNQKANAWKIDYRKYHDLWVPDNALDGIWVNVKPASVTPDGDQSEGSK